MATLQACTEIKVTGARKESNCRGSDPYCYIAIDISAAPILGYTVAWLPVRHCACMPVALHIAPLAILVLSDQGQPDQGGNVLHNMCRDATSACNDAACLRLQLPPRETRDNVLAPLQLYDCTKTGTARTYTITEKPSPQCCPKCTGTVAANAIRYLKPTSDSLRLVTGPCDTGYAYYGRCASNITRHGDLHLYCNYRLRTTQS